MGTRIAPGRFDCHAAALPDEPQFTLLARDPLAGFLVSIWSSLRMAADVEAARAKFRKMRDVAAAHYWTDPDVEKASEALDCAMAMFAWRKENDGRWRDAPPAAAHDPVAEALGAAVMALRSYQYGNSAPDLAKSIADEGEAALRAAGFPPGFMAMGGSQS